MQAATPRLSLVRPETRRPDCLAKWYLRVVLLLGVVVALASQATAAPVVFDVSAQSGEGWTVSGTVTIDTATGKVLSADLTAKDGASTQYIFDVVDGVHQISGRPGSPVWTKMSFAVGSGASGFGSPALFLTVPGATLVGYKGSGILNPVLPGGYSSCLEISSGYFNPDAGPLEIPLYGSMEP
jgi:hypothetical protein